MTKHEALTSLVEGVLTFARDYGYPDPYEKVHQVLEEIKAKELQAKHQAELDRQWSSIPPEEQAAILRGRT